MLTPSLPPLFFFSFAYRGHIFLQFDTKTGHIERRIHIFWKRKKLGYIWAQLRLYKRYFHENLAGRWKQALFGRAGALTKLDLSRSCINYLPRDIFHPIGTRVMGLFINQEFTELKVRRQECKVLLLGISPKTSQLGILQGDDTYLVK